MRQPKWIINRITRRWGVQLFPYVSTYSGSERGRQAVFESHFTKNFWGSGGSRSGIGSEAIRAAPYRSRLEGLLERRRISSMFDAPCGDLAWMGKLLEGVSDLEYIGADISPNLIREMRRTHPTLDLRQFDVCIDVFPKVDVWHCRDCLFHLSFDEMWDALRNFALSEIPWALITTHRSRWLRNEDIETGGFRFLDLEKAPFSLPAANEYLADYAPGVDFPRYVGLWSRAQIASTLRREGRL